MNDKSKSFVAEEVWETDFLRSALDQHAIVSITDVEGDITFVNNKFCEFSGYGRDELIGRNHRILMSGEHPDAMYREMWRTIAKGQTWHGDIKNRRKDGSFYWVRASIIPRLDPNGKPNQYFSICTDITHLKEVERELVESTARYRFFVDNIDEGVIVAEKGKIIDVSDVWASLFRCRPEQAIGRSPLDYTAPEMHDYVKGLIAAGHGGQYESKLLRQDGTIFPALVRGRNLDFGGREVRLTTVLDITTQKEAEQALLQSQEKLKHEIEIKNKFFSIIAHDLRGPFTTLLGMTQLLAKMGSEFSQEKIIDYANVVHESGERVFNLLQNLLEWARQQMDGSDPMPETINLGELADDCIGVIGPAAQVKGVTISSRLTEETAYADQEMIRTVFRNLVANAMKFTPSGGSVKIRSFTEDGMTCVQVVDNGVGMSEAQAKEIFSLVKQTSTKGTQGETGTGLGLPLCKDMVERNGGRIWVVSKEGEGSQFTFTIPQGERSLFASTGNKAIY